MTLAIKTYEHLLALHAGDVDAASHLETLRRMIAPK